MSLITILATFALAIPMNESAPVWSVITPTLMDDSFIAFSPFKTGRGHRQAMPAVDNRDVLHLELPGIENVERARRPSRLPELFTQEEARAVLSHQGWPFVPN